MKTLQKHAVEQLNLVHLKQHSRFLSTDSPLVPVTASTKVLLLRPHDLLECTHIGSDEKRKRGSLGIHHQMNQASEVLKNINT